MMPPKNPASAPRLSGPCPVPTCWLPWTCSLLPLTQCRTTGLCLGNSTKLCSGSGPRSMAKKENLGQKYICRARCNIQQFASLVSGTGRPPPAFPPVLQPSPLTAPSLWGLSGVLSRAGARCNHMAWVHPLPAGPPQARHWTTLSPSSVSSAQQG